MPLTTTHRKFSNGFFTSEVEKVEVTHRFEVAEVRTFVADRNHSDTLDYSDWRSTQVTEALVYVGRVRRVNPWNKEDTRTEEVPVLQRFAWRDCTNLFSDRSGQVTEAKKDECLHPNALADYLDWKVEMQKEEARNAAERAKWEAEEKARKEEEERDRPVVGKPMTVVSGRKVKPGTVGTVAFISGSSGKVLLKDDAKWRDRKADGIWVDPRHLKARPTK